MVDQTQVNSSQASQPNGRTELPPRAVARSTAEFLHDVTTLVELQGKLTLLDFHEGVAKLLAPAALVLVGIAVGLGCVPIALAALALTLSSYTTLPLPACFGIALAVGLVLAATLTIPSLMALKHGVRMFDRSLYEWGRNRKWIKDTLQRLGQSSRVGPAHQPTAGRWPHSTTDN
jgi:hypothetical protein